MLQYTCEIIHQSNALFQTLFKTTFRDCKVLIPDIKVIAQGKQIDLVFMIMNHEGQIKSEFLRDSKGITQSQEAVNKILKGQLNDLTIQGCSVI